jgi:CRP/FNR family transcriptional regulator, cyclic AMP receptor protein
VAVAFLQRLDPNDRADLIRLGHPRRHRRGAPLTLQGDRTDTAFLLLRGRVKVTVDTLDGHEIVVSVLGPGDLLGEFEPLDDYGGPRTANVIALEPVECRVLTGTEFRSYLDSHPRATRMLLQVIIDRLVTADRRRIDSGSLDAAHRLARLFVEFVDLAERDIAEGQLIDLDIPLTQHELATLIATSRESLVRALASMRKQGFISTARRSITICDLDGLRRYAH